MKNVAVNLANYPALKAVVIEPQFIPLFFHLL